jgi:bromodomain-containing factor 1
MLRTLKRKSEAGPFLHPVDPVALNIPTYVDIITHPMDLGTVERKIQTGQYKDVDEFASDMRLIWQNCITFNGPDNAVSIWAKTLSTLFEKQIQRMPTLAAVSDSKPGRTRWKMTDVTWTILQIQAEQIAKRSTSPSDSKKSKSGSGSSKPRRPSQAGGSRLSESQRKQQSYEAEYDDYGTAPSTSRPQSGGGGNKKKGKAPQQLQQHQMGMPMGGYGGPAMQNGNLNNEQLKFCKEVIKELFKKQHSAFAYPFYEPVGMSLSTSLVCVSLADQ